MELLYLIVMLVSDSVETRDRASARILEMGRGAWPLLERALESRDPELRGRACDLLSRQMLTADVLSRHPDLEREFRHREILAEIGRKEWNSIPDLVARGDEALILLVQSLEDPRSTSAARYFAVRALREFRDERLAPTLRATEALSLRPGAPCIERAIGRIAKGWLKEHAASSPR